MTTTCLLLHFLHRLPKEVAIPAFAQTLHDLLEKDTSEATRLELVADLYQSHLDAVAATDRNGQRLGDPLFTELITNFITHDLDYHLDVTAENASWFIRVIPRLPPAVQIDLLRKIATADPECRKWVLDWDNTPMGLIRELRGN